VTRRRPEQQLQRAVIDHIAWRAHPDAFAFHYPAGGWRSPIEAAILKSIGTIAGIPDIVIERLRRAGATVVTAFGLDQALAQLVRWDLLRGAA
jgi:hypothetical protein